MKRSEIRRGNPLERRTSLQSSGMDIARAWLARSKALGRKPVTRKVRDTGPDKATRELVLARDEHRCQWCGLGRDLQLQHRRPRQRGGDRSPEVNLPSNLIVLCLVCHDRVEHVERLTSYDLGLLVHRHEDPASKPVWTFRGWVLLTPDGRAVPASGEGEASS